jgi:cobaltochelatase CobS
MSDYLNDRVTKAIAAHLGKAVPEVPAMPNPTPEPVAVAPKAPIKLGEHQQLYSKVFGYTPKGGDFAITVLPTSTNPDIVRLIPTLDADYVVQKEEAALLVAGIEDGDKSLITGPTGSGKSSLVKYVCAKLNRPFIRINMSGDVESAALFGTLVVRGGATVWEDGAVTEAVKYGAVALVDEWELMPAEIAMGMQNLLEDGGYLYLKEKPGTSADRTMIPDSNFRLVFAGNTVGQGDTTGSFSGVGVQNTATIDRFTNTVRLSYLDMKHEIAIITSKTNVTSAVATKMVKLAGLVRSAYDSGKVGLTMSPRTLINWARKQTRYTPEYALQVAFLEKLNIDDSKTVREFYTKVFGA